MSEKQSENKIYDLIIIGAGPAGLSGSVYASRYGLSNIIIGELVGGLAAMTHEIGNWLGTEKISGFDFAQNAVAHAKSYGVEIETNRAEKINKLDKSFKIVLSNDREVVGKTLLLAMGTEHRKLDIPGEKELAGKGVSYCATCDGFFFRNKTVAVIGGNDSAAGAAVYLANIAVKVYIIYRKEELRCEKFWKMSIENNPKIEVINNAQVKEIRGEQKVVSLLLDKNYNGSDNLPVDGLFIEIGSLPNTELLKKLDVKTDEDGYIKIDAEGRTSHEGVWAAGDITTGSNKFKQIVTAAAEGAIAVVDIQKYLKKVV